MSNSDENDKLLVGLSALASGLKSADKLLERKPRLWPPFLSITAGGLAALTVQSRDHFSSSAPSEVQ